MSTLHSRQKYRLQRPKRESASRLCYLRYNEYSILPVPDHRQTRMYEKGLCLSTCVAPPREIYLLAHAHVITIISSPTSLYRNPRLSPARRARRRNDVESDGGQTNAGSANVEERAKRVGRVASLGLAGQGRTSASASDCIIFAGGISLDGTIVREQELVAAQRGLLGCRVGDNKLAAGIQREDSGKLVQ